VVKGIQRHVTFHVLPGKVAEFEQFFVQEYHPAMAATEGFLQASLLKDAAEPQDLIMVLRFDTLESAAAWRNSAGHAALKPRLKSLYSASELEVYEVLA
jgi:heme-degrading monooxygenase HmoA